MYQIINKGISLIKKTGAVPIFWLDGCLEALEKHPNTLKWIGILILSSISSGKSIPIIISLYKSIFK